MLKTFSYAALLSLFAYASVSAGAGTVTVDQSSKVFRLDGGNTTYAFGVNARGELQQIYWGGRWLLRIAIPRRIPTARVGIIRLLLQRHAAGVRGLGRRALSEPALKVTFADGNRDLVLHYAQSSQAR